MKFLKSFIRNLIVLIGVVLILALVNRWYLGGFSKLEVQETNIG
jgi:Ni,Fe-hydrogenase I cytochrome b subunit